MRFCKRTSNDPLLRLFLVEYRVNLLNIPRKDVRLGSIFVVRGQDIDNIPLADLINGTVDIVEATSTDNLPIEQVTETRSGALDIDGSVSLLGRIREAFGLPGGKDRLQAALRNNGAQTIEIKLEGLLCARVRRDKIARDLASCHLVEGHAYNDGKSILYICTGIWKATALELRATGENATLMDVSAAIEDVADAEAKLEVKRGDLLATIVRAGEPLVFGVELMQIGVKDGGLALLDRRPELHMRGDDQPVTELSMIETPDDDAFLSVRQKLS